MCVKNVGRMDAYVRISAGLMMVSLGIMKHKGWMAALGSCVIDIEEDDDDEFEELEHQCGCHHED